MISIKFPKKNSLFNPDWRENFRDPPKNLVLKLQTAISKTIQVRQTIYTAFKRGASGLSNQFLNCRAEFKFFARVVSLTAFQHVLKHAVVTLTQSCPQWYKVATEENMKNGNFAHSFFYVLVPFL